MQLPLGLRLRIPALSEICLRAVPSKSNEGKSPGQYMFAGIAPLGYIPPPSAEARAPQPPRGRARGEGAREFGGGGGPEGGRMTPRWGRFF
jgi:hypothetical protein